MNSTALTSRTAKWAATLLQRLPPPPTTDLVAALTLFLLIFHPFQVDVYDLVLMLVIPVLCWRPRWLSHPGLWAILGGFGTYAVLSDYAGSDNHKWLYMYWTWVLASAFVQERREAQEETIVLNARFFLVASMGLAVFWKLVSRDFVSGAFMEYTFLSDGRFEPLMQWIGVPESMTEQWYEQVDDFQFTPGFQQVFDVPWTVAWLATSTTWWILLSEGAIAVLFALRRRWTDQIGHIALMGFVLTTYLIAPVIGFGTILCILGLALARIRFPSSALGYGYLFCLIVLAIYDFAF